MDLRSTVLVVGGSLCSFKLLNTLVRFLPTLEPACKKQWKWRNTWTSLAHSALTGAWAVLCLHRQPQMLEDLITSHSLLSHSLVAVSTGYFIHDFLDVGLNQPLKQSWELLVHHGTVISCFSLAVTSRLYVSLAVVSLLIEIHSVFLHIRMLLLLSGRRNRPGTEATAARPSVAYNLTRWLNMGTLLVFRVCTMGWMTRWLASHFDLLPRFVLMMGTVGTSLISMMNVVLFYRLLRADFLTNTHNSNSNH
ncbi:TLC domain-containing protein 2-like isoform X2 [Notolabrus celidotus]|nr:TLC domain-containing protein 2-like isoform X2 [Notolabrus celidotus]XP_034538972.1 TLC domain-containing protein 2-like isoform X2 [Notolabrus celidotus]XP_034538973.1 TLC domain-containing protein 2-like isoform X2 [Notolabrus celidotus]XP_034538974.1 TLC domain-containing protein 2-like isoform X2 [Notolabrus celidotus]